MSEPMRTPDDVLATMATQRAAGWPDWHPEDYCHRCGGRNASWHVDSDRFNAAMGPPTLHRWNGIICPGCFVELHEAATGLTATWTLSPDTPFRHIDPEPEPVVPEYVICSCCGELDAPTFPDGEYACGCEWEGCDKDCPVVGHLFDADPEPDVSVDNPQTDRACGPYCGCDDDKEQTDG